MAYVNALVNAPWARDGRNCWRFVREVVEQFGYALPVIIENAPSGKTREGRDQKLELWRRAEERKNWCATGDRSRWAVVPMHRPHRPAAEIEHYGVFLPIDGGVYAHCCDPYGVVMDTLAELRGRRWEPALYLAPR